MDALVIAVASFLAAGLTLFSGFGLGTLLMPVVAIFFPVDVAVGVTAVVHLANNCFKLLLVGRSAESSVVLRFGLPAVAASFIGAACLLWLSAAAPAHELRLLGASFDIVPAQFVVGLLIVLFVALELVPWSSHLSFGAAWLPLGGILSGFFGGLSGHQGALRSMFLMKSGLSKEAFIGTGVVIAVLVDVARLCVYGLAAHEAADRPWILIAIATASAFSGSFLGARLIHKVTYRTVQALVSALLVLVAVGLITGLL